MHIIKETCLMKCNIFYEDQCCTSCFKSEGTKITECPSYCSACQELNHYIATVPLKDLWTLNEFVMCFFIMYIFFSMPFIWLAEKLINFEYFNLTSFQKLNCISRVIRIFSIIITSIYRPHCPTQALHCGGLPKLNKNQILIKTRDIRTHKA